MLFTSLLLSIIAHAAHAKIQESGLFYNCNTPDNEIKITADLSDKKGDKSAVITFDGSNDIYREIENRKIKHFFSVNTKKGGQVEVRKAKGTPPFITLSFDPINDPKRLAQSQDGLTINKFSASLTVAGLPIQNVRVSCLESTWTYEQELPPVKKKQNQ